MENSSETLQKLSRADISSDHSLVLCNIKLKLKKVAKKLKNDNREVKMLRNETICNKYEEVAKGLER